MLKLARDHPKNIIFRSTKKTKTNKKHNAKNKMTSVSLIVCVRFFFCII